MKQCDCLSKGKDPYVIAGISLLNRECPYWFERIDLSKLDMMSCEYCILGQLYGDYCDGALQLGLNADDAKDYGFDKRGIKDIDEEWFDLNRTWKMEIERIRGEIHG